MVQAACATDGDPEMSPEPETGEIAPEPVRYPVTIDLGGSGAGTVTAAAAGIDCPGTCTGMAPHGSVLELTAGATAPSMFLGWTIGPDGSACTGTGACATTITGATTVTATFALQQALEVTRSGTGHGGVVSSPGGIECGTDCSELYPPGTSVTLTAVPSEGSTFAGWTGRCEGAGPCTVDIDAAKMVTAEFQLLQHELTVEKTGGAGTVTSAPAGIDCGESCAASYAHGAMVTLTAAAPAGSTFLGWSGGGCTGTGSCTVTMTAAASVTAQFEANQYTLSVIKFGSGGGGVTSLPAGINCSPSCNATFAHGTVVTLTATAAAFNVFGGWNGGGCSGTGTCTVTMTSSMTIGANFQKPIYTLSVAKTGGGSGTVTSSPGNINCGSTCSAPIPSGSWVFLNATPANGSVFAGWSGGGCTGTDSCSMQLAGNTTVTAMFVPAAVAPPPGD